MDAPETMAISVITLGELRAGVRLAGDPSARAARQRRLVAIRDAFEPIPVDETVAEHYGDVLATARSAGRATKATDLLIIATAAATGRILHTLDTRQTALAQAAGIQVRSNA
jgi:predicted nucleic acid-binding protein